MSDLCELSELQDVSLSCSTDNPLPFPGHILIFLSNRTQLRAKSSAKPPGSDVWIKLFNNNPPLSKMLRFYWHLDENDISPGFDKEAVLDEDSDNEKDHPFHCHGKQVLTNHVPFQRGAEMILSCIQKKHQAVRIECVYVIMKVDVETQPQVHDSLNFFW